MRELYYLLEELNRMKEENPRSASDIDALIKQMQETRAEHQAASDAGIPGSGVSEEEAHSAAASVGTRDDNDEYLIDFLKKEGLVGDCELTIRILLKRMRDVTKDLIAE